MLIFSGQKPCTRIISNILHSFFTLFEGYKCNTCKLYETTPKKRFFLEPKKTNFKHFKFYKMKPYTHDDFTCVFSIEIYFHMLA